MQTNNSDQNPIGQRTLNYLKSSLLAKALIMGAVMLLLMIPKGMIIDLIAERQERNDQVVKEISSKWGGGQSIHGPVLSIPFTQKIKNESIVQSLHLHPTELDISGVINPKVRKRSIFKAVLYQSSLSFKGYFDLSLLDTMNYNFHFDQASIAFSISDLSGLSKSVTLTALEKTSSAQPGIKIANGMSQGFHFPISLKEYSQKKLSFDSDMHLNGSQNLAFLPSGKITRIQLTSPWLHPSFQGDFLPNTQRVDSKGFQANWEVHDLQRTFQQSWIGSRKIENSSSCGLSLIQVQDTYSQVNRVVKYAILFLSFTFGAMFICERLSRKSIHPLQYILVGLASLIFYVLLLALSEHLNFNAAYMVTSSLTTTLITAYAKGLFQSWKNTFTIGALTGGLYTYLFGTIQLEEYALIMGSSGLFLVLAIVMYFTRSLNNETSSTLQTN